jgi:crossover junction endonuclease MUS81
VGDILAVRDVICLSAKMSNKHLFMEWTREIVQDYAGNRDKKHIYQTYLKALVSLEAYTAPLILPTDAAAVKFVGRSLITKFEQRLREHCTMNGIDYPGHEHVASPLVEKRQQTKDYVPRYKSGGYALLLGLYQHHRAHVGQKEQFIDKEALMHLAQPFSETPMDKPMPGAGFYTAWSSMSTLLEKGLVVTKRGKKKLFALSDKGLDMASKLDDTEVTVPAKRPAPDEPNVQMKRTSSVLQHASTFRFLYVDSNGQSTERLENARMDFDASTFTLKYRIAFSPGQTSDILTRIASTIEPFGTLLQAWIGEDDAPPTAPGIPSFNVPTTPPVPTLQRSNSLLPANSFHKSQPMDHCSPTATTITFPAHSYTIHLITDSREINSRSFRNIVHDLSTLGVESLVRPLELGDFLWIAKSNDQEIVLDCIVERKTLHDLIDSVMDGRYKDQKYRLERCGLERIVYVVEGYNATDAESFNHDTIRTTLSSIQVVHGFFLKMTTSLQDTASYLASLTRVLQERYHGKELLGVQMDAGQKAYATHKQTLQAQHPSATILPTMVTFARMNRKMANFSTIGDILPCLLRSIQGISGDKVTTIVQRYPTMASLLGAYEQCTDEQERDSLLVNQTGPLPRRNISLVLSQRLHHVLYK